MVGAVRRVVLDAPAELRPDQRQHAVGEAAGLEVALEREQRVAHVGEVLAVRQIWSSWLSKWPPACTVATRMPRPAPSMRATLRSDSPVPVSGYGIGVGGGSLPASGFSAWLT